MLSIILVVTLTVTVLGNAFPQELNIEKGGIQYKVLNANNSISVEIDCHMGRIQVVELPRIFNESNANSIKVIVIKECQLPQASLQKIFLGLGTRNRITMLTLANISIIKREHFDQVTLIDKVVVLDSSVTSNAFSGLTKCETIELHNSSFSISTKSFTYATDLRALVIEQSNLTDLVDTFLSQHYDLRLLNLEKNLITEVTNSFFEKLTSLSELNLSNNLLTSLPDNFLRSIPSLKYLYLNSNPLKEISSNSMRGSNIIEFFLDNNTVPLTLAPGALADMPRLIKINLRNCSIKALPADLLQGSDNVDAIHLSHNLIQELPDDVFVNKSELCCINLRNNQLKKISAANFAFLPSMEWLYLEDNAITELSRSTFSSMTMLWTLMLQNNRIHSVSPDAFPASLQILYLSNNKLTTLETTRLPFLSMLDLSNNSLSSVPPSWRENYPALESADILNNSFTRLTAADFAAMPKDFMVSLSKNKIVSIEVDQNTSLPTLLWLVGAPLRCDCWMHAFASRLQNETGKSHRAYCAEPASLSGTHLTKVPLTDLVCHLEFCPDTCSCTVRPEIKALKVKCGKQITEEQLKKLEYLRQKHYNNITDNMIFVLGN